MTVHPDHKNNMSISVNQLTKIYGNQKAVDDLSFSVGKNEIVGFLGPNGAGKSTTLKIATGYLTPSSGTVCVAGLNVSDKPIEVKRKIGYLPEHNPLYLEMYVHEYLHFSGRFYNLKGSKLQSRCQEVIGMCGLQAEQNKKIGQLSKGYRQRVGLAQALLHEPEVLLLDEPTTGLDPNQLIEVRELIRKISHDRTVLFSTHIMQEVQALCNRVIIIDNGKLVADDQLDNILAKSSSHVLEVEFEESIPEDLLRNYPGIRKIAKITDKQYQLFTRNDADIRPELMKYLAEQDLPLIGIKRKETTMEDVFSSLTKAGQHV